MAARIPFVPAKTNKAFKNIRGFNEMCARMFFPKWKRAFDHIPLHHLMLAHRWASPSRARGSCLWHRSIWPDGYYRWGGWRGPGGHWRCLCCRRWSWPGRQCAAHSSGWGWTHPDSRTTTCSRQTELNVVMRWIVPGYWSGSPWFPHTDPYPGTCSSITCLLIQLKLAYSIILQSLSRSNRVGFAP